jgi:hypothetical protein
MIRDRNKLLQPGGCKISAKKWYPFMWKGRFIDYEDVASGFLLGDLLIKVKQHFWATLWLITYEYADLQKNMVRIR